MSIESDEVIARSINALVDKNVITAHDASQADPNAINEFVSRQGPKAIQENGFDIDLEWIAKETYEGDKYPDKIRRIFKSELVENALSQKEKQRTLQNAIQYLREILITFDKWADRLNPPDLRGFILVGSLVDPKKMTTTDSDLDVIAVGNNLNPVHFLYEMHHQHDKEKIPIDSIGVDKVITIDEIIDILKPDSIQPIDYWQLADNQGILYIGSLPTENGELLEEEATKLLREYMRSPKLQLMRKNRLLEEENNLVNSVENYTK